MRRTSSSVGPGASPCAAPISRPADPARPLRFAAPPGWSSAGAGAGVGCDADAYLKEANQASVSSIEQFVMNFFSDGSARGYSAHGGGLWGRVSTRCNRIGRGGHRELHGTHVCRRPKAQLANPRSQEVCTFCFCFLGGGLLCTYKLGRAHHTARVGWHMPEKCVPDACQMLQRVIELPVVSVVHAVKSVG